MKPSTDALLDTIQELSLESKTGDTTLIKISHLDQLRLEILDLRMANTKLSKRNNQLSDSVGIARDRIHDLNQSMIEITYGQNNFDSRLKKRLFDTIG